MTLYPTSGLRLLAGVPLVTPPTPPPPPPSTTIWIPLSSCGYLAFNLTDDGNVPPQLFVAGPSTGLTGPRGNGDSFTLSIGTDTTRNVYALAVLGQLDFTTTISVVKFPQDADGDATPTTTIVLPANYLGGTYDGLCLDDSNRLYVANRETIYRYPAGASSGTSPDTWLTLTDPILDCNASALFFDTYRQWIWVADNFRQVVEAYDLTATRQRKIGNGNDLFLSPNGVCAGKDGRIYVSDGEGSPGYGVIFVFAADANGVATPIQTISGATSMIDDPSGVGVDNIDQTIYVAQGNGIDDAKQGILVFSPDATGDVAPIRFISGNLTQLNDVDTGNANGISIGVR